MPRKKKKDPLERFKETATTLINDGKFPCGASTYLLKELIRDNKSKGYFCTLTRDGRDIMYSHVNPGKTKLEAVYQALNHLEMMGREGLSAEPTDS